MSWIGDVKSKINDTLSGVANIGAVFSYRPYDQKASLIMSAFPDYKGAFIEFVSQQEEVRGNRLVHSTAQFQITLFAPVVDSGASATAFESVLEAAQDALRAADGLDVPGGIATAQQAGSIAATPALISNVLCHVATINFSVKRRIL